MNFKRFLFSIFSLLFLGKEGLTGPQGPPGLTGERGKFSHSNKSHNRIKSTTMADDRCNAKQSISQAISIFDSF